MFVGARPVWTLGFLLMLLLLFEDVMLLLGCSRADVEAS